MAYHLKGVNAKISIVIVLIAIIIGALLLLNAIGRLNNPDPVTYLRNQSDGMSYMYGSIFLFVIAGAAGIYAAISNKS